MLSWSFRSVQICASCVRFVSLCISLCSVARQFYHLQNGRFASNLPCFGAANSHLLPEYLCCIKITSPLWGLLFFTFGLQFAAFRSAFCSILPCVLQRFALRFAAFCTAFCCILPYFLLQKRNCFASFVYLCSIQQASTLLCAVPIFTLITPCNTPFFAAEWQAG